MTLKSHIDNASMSITRSDDGFILELHHYTDIYSTPVSMIKEYKHLDEALERFQIGVKVFSKGIDNPKLALEEIFGKEEK